MAVSTEVRSNGQIDPQAGAAARFDERTGCWVVTGRAEVGAVLADRETFSDDNAHAPMRCLGEAATRLLEGRGSTARFGLPDRVPPEHARIQHVVARAFTPLRCDELEPAIRIDVVVQLERMLGRPGRVGDLVPDLASEIPIVTILTLLGAELSQVPTLTRRAASRGALTWRDLTEAEQIPHAYNMVAYWHECQRLVADAHATEQDSFVGDLVRAQRAGEPISDHDIVSLCYSMLAIGHETTATFIADVLRVLLGHPDLWQRLVADPTSSGSALSEVLRHGPADAAWRRRTTKDVVLGGVKIPKGADLLLVVGPGDRPDAFDVLPPDARENLAFGYGIPYRLGYQLATVQARIAAEEVAMAVPDLRLADPDVPGFGSGRPGPAPMSVPVTWD